MQKYNFNSPPDPVGTTLPLAIAPSPHLNNAAWFAHPSSSLGLCLWRNQMRVTPPSALAVLLRYNVISDRHPCRSFAHRQLKTPPSHPRSLGVAVFCPLCHPGGPPPVPETDQEGRGATCALSPAIAPQGLYLHPQIELWAHEQDGFYLIKKASGPPPSEPVARGLVGTSPPSTEARAAEGLAAGRIVRGKMDGNHRSRIRGPPGQLDRVSMACS